MVKSRADLTIIAPMIRLARPAMGDEEHAAIGAVLRSGMLVQGEQVARFESLLAKRCARSHAVAVANGTCALDLALEVLEIGPGDEVICPDLTWPSPAHAVLRRGATPVLIDVDLAEWNSGASHFAAARSDKTRAAIVIHQFGFPARFAEIEAAMPGVPLLVDAACAIGSETERGPAAQDGVIACLSFHPRKVLTTGEGGMCLTNDDGLATRLRTLRNHGQLTGGNFVEAGPNFRLTEMQGAMGIAQLAKLDGIVAERAIIASRYREELRELSFQAVADGARTNHQTMGALLPAGFDAARRTRFVEAMKSRDVESGILSYALHRIGSMSTARRASELANASAIVDRGVALPIHSELTSGDQARVIAAVRASLEEVA